MNKRGKMWKNLLSFVMVFAMMMSLMVVPAKNVQAEERIQITVNDAANTSNDVHIVLEKVQDIAANSNAEGNWPAQALTEYKLYIQNGLEKNISDWSVTIQLADTPYWGYGYSGTTQSGNTISIVTYNGTNEAGEVWNNMTVEAGEKKDTGAGFAIPASALTGATYTLTYYEGESSGSAGRDDAESDPAAIGTTSESVTATFTTSNIAGEYHEYFLKVNNGLSDSIGDWIIKVPMTGVTSTEDWSSWADVVTYYTSDCLYIVPKSGTVLGANSSVGGTDADSAGNYKINYKGSSALDNASVVVYFVKGSSSTGAFDSVVSNASGGSSSGGSGGSGGTFDGENIGTIDTSTNYNFAKLLQLSLYFYDANMCGDQVSETSLYSTDVGGWRGDCHVNDYFTYNGKQYKAVGGFHDAGDHVKFGMPANESFITLGLSYLEFGQAFDELGQKEHFKKIVDYYCTYLKSCTVLDSTGEAAEAFCYQVGCGQKDHESWVAPEVENESSTNRTYSLVATSSNPATEYVAGAAAALAINYLNFGNTEDLKYAKALFAMAKNNAKSTGSTDTSGSFYASGSWEDEYCLAAAMLYKITKDSTYATEYNSNNANASNIQKPNGWCNLYQFASYYAPTKNESEWNTINSWLASQASGSTSSYYSGDDSWGTARINCNVQFSALLYDKLNNVDTYATWCRYQMSTILGNNSKKINLVCGYNDASPKKPHHRAASGYAGWTDFNNNATQKYTLYGALVGGPTSADFSTYTDAVNDAICNEVTLDYNAGMVGAAAALYLLYKDSTEDGFTEQTVLSDFYGGSGFTSAQMPSGYGGGSDTPVVSVESISVTPATTSEEPVELQIGETASATVTITPDDATNKDYKVSSDDTSVASVTKTTTGFKVEGKATGTAAITVTASGDTTKKAVYYVKVVAPAITSISLDKDSVSLDGTEKEATATITVLPATADKTKISVTSSDEDVATASISGSTLTITSGLKSGTATITLASSEDPTMKATCEVTVTHSVTGFTVDKDSLSIAVSEKATLSVDSVEPVGADEYTVNWSVEDDTVVSLDKTTGDSVEITGLKVGTTTVTAKIGKISKNVEVTVTKRKQEKPTVTFRPILQAAHELIVQADTESEGTLELSLDRKNWIQQSEDGNYVFSDLEDGTDYTVYARLAQTDDMEASEVSNNTISVFTVFDVSKIKDENGNYVIDISKISAEDFNYVNKLSNKIEEGILDTNFDFTVLGNDIIITTKKGNDYVIAGANENVVVNVTNGSNLILKDAAVRQLVVNSTSAIALQGTNRVTDGILVPNNGTLTIDKIADDEDASIVISNEEGPGISGNGNLVINGGNINVSATNNSGIQVNDFTVNGGNVSVSSPNGIGIEAEDVVLNGTESVIQVESEDAAISGINVEVTGADVTLEVTGSNASVIEATGDITLNSGSVATTRPEGNNGYDYEIINPDSESAGQITIGEDVTISGNPEYSIPPVDSNGDQITFVNVTVYNGDTSFVLKCKKNTTCKLLEDATIKKLIAEEPYRTIVFLVDNNEIEDGVLDVKEQDEEVSIQWVATEYTITYECNGGSFTDETYKTTYTVDDGDYTLPTNITKDKFSFQGWYLDSDFTDKISSVSVATHQNVTVYAKWMIDEPEAPVITKVKNVNGGIYVKWNLVDGANYYILYRKVSGGSWDQIAQTQDGTSFTYTDKTVENGKSYSYQVSAYGMSEGEKSTASKLYYCVSAPKISGLSNTATGVTVKWNKISGATGYVIYKTLDGTTYEKVAIVKGEATISYHDAKATGVNTKYRYRVFAYKTVSGTNYLSGPSISKSIYHLTKPATPEVVVSSVGLKVAWAATTGASGYHVYRSTNGGTFVKVATLTGQVFYDKKVENGKKYQYKIMAYKMVSGITYRSAMSGAKTYIYLGKPSIISLTNSASKTMTVKWTKNSYASGYEIQYSLSGDFRYGDSLKITGNTVTSKKVTGLTKGKTYYVRVRSIKVVNGVTYYSKFSPTKSVKITK
ncbi:MAG: glycoside hydrolase family 9 protein [Lachnospiraceae bacterium]